MDGCGSLLRRRGTLASAPGVPARPYLLTGAREDSEAAILATFAVGSNLDLISSVHNSEGKTTHMSFSDEA